MGPLLRAVNSVADAIRTEFPHVAIDTLAYDYSLPPPNLTVPRPNVIVRLCSIGANFGVPMTDPSNAVFQRDMEGWAAISTRTYVWDYTVNFGACEWHYPSSRHQYDNVDQEFRACTCMYV